MSFSCWIRCKLTHHACAEVDMPKQCRLAFESLGATYIKLGQVLSMRPDIIPKEYLEEFQKLQEHAPPVAFEIVQDIVERELKGPMEKLFREFDRKPVAAASLGQVHRALLHDGTEVAVKVQRPRMKVLLLRDLRILEFIVRRMDKHLPEIRHVRPIEAIHTFRTSVMNEIDYRIEAQNADRYAYQFKSEPGIRIPRVFWDHTTRHVLTIEFIRGIRMGDTKAIRDHGIDHDAVLQHCMRGCLLPVFVHGFFHADPHPGNVWILKDGRICYLDFGMMGTIGPEDRRNMLLHILFLSQERVQSAIYYLMKIAQVTREDTINDYTQEVISLIASYYQHPHEKTATETLYAMIYRGARYGIYFPSGMVMLAKALMTCETMCRMTHGQMDFLKSTQPILQEIAARELGPGNVLREFEQAVPEFAALIAKLPSFVTEIIGDSPGGSKPGNQSSA